jgi:MoaA/NifB/PqqE/SkfB family radical SAM enzyme
MGNSVIERGNGISVLAKLISRNITRERAISEVIFFVTNKCNGACSNCLYRDQLNTGDDNLSLDEIRKLSSALGEVKLLLISGGEPFLREDLKEIIMEFVEINKTKYVSIPTNGLLKDRIVAKTKEILQESKGIILHETVSLDGMAKINDQMRGVEGHFAKAVSTVKELCKLKKEFPNLIVKITTTVSKTNIQCVENLFKYVSRELDVDGHIFQPARKSPGNTNVQMISGDEWKELTSRLWQFRRKHLQQKKDRLFIFLYKKGYDMLNTVVAKALEGEKWPFFCLAGASIGVIDHEGSVRLCEQGERIGNIRGFSYDFQQVWSEKKAATMRKRIESGECSRYCVHGCFMKPSFLSGIFGCLRKFL